MAHHKDEAIRALDQVVARLKGAEPIEGLARFQLAASVEYALGELHALQEVKRVRRVTDSPATMAEPTGG